MDSLPLPRRELPSAPGFPSCFLSALRAAAVVPFRSLGYLSFRFLPLVVLPETLSLLRFAWLADWVAICQPGFYWRLKAYSYLRSCETSEGFCQVNCGHEHHDCGSSFPQGLGCSS
jgi:hypothetical protein